MPPAPLPPTRGLGGEWSSIERQLPLLLCVLLAPAIVILVAWSYVENRRSLITAATNRIEAGAREIGAQLSQGAVNLDTEVRRIATLTAIRDCLQHSGEEYEAAARRTLESLFRRSSAPGTGELWTIDGTCIVTAKQPHRPGVEPQPELHAYDGGPPDAVGIQPIGSAGATSFFEMVGEVFGDPPAGSSAGATGPLIGHVVIRQALGGNRQIVDLLGGLIGSEATLLLGARGRDDWTDLDHPVAPPPVDPLDPEQRYHRGADGSDRIGAGFEVSGTPWILWIETAAGDALAPARTAAMRMAVVSAVLLALGVVGAWLAGRRVTAPLRAATAAAEAIAAGRFDRRLAVHAPAEMGRLSNAFNIMTERVLQSRHDLERRVDARTAALKDTLRQLHDAQDSLVRKERLATLGQLAGSVGHELRNPLGVMTNAVYYLEMILETAPDEVREYLGILRHQVHLSEKIISDLLDFARLRPPQTRAVKVDEIVDEQVARLGPFAGTIERSIPADLAPAWVDPVQAGQVVYNLLTNAVQAMDAAGGTLTLRGIAADGRRVGLEVADTGPGVPDELRDKIFEPLFTTRARGIGLGLAVSRRLAENNGGELRLEPARGGSGATFTLLLPIATAEGA